MAMLKNYDEFVGRHWETGTVRNALAYQGVKAPHTGKPISEALLLGVSGGIAFGYFTFEYEGYPPHLVLLTRNTFNPMDTMLERLSIPQDVYQTDSAKKGEANLLEVLEGNHPAIIWADMFSLPYYDLPYDENNWGMMPILVYGYENGVAHIADRAGRPFTVSADDLAKARGRVKQDEYRVVALEAPNWDRLSRAVTEGIEQSIRLFLEYPPKGKRENFGAAALQYWANMLTNTRNKQSWARYFEPGERMWLGLAGSVVQPGAYGFIKREPGNSAERGMYADFLDEAAIILKKPALNEAAAQFRQSESAWSALAEMMLPDDVPLLKEAKNLLNRKQAVFVEQGGDGLSEIRAINMRFAALQAEAAANFPLDEAQLTAFRERLSEQVLKIRDVETQAFNCLQAVMG